jgi:hypothetical protein
VHVIPPGQAIPLDASAIPYLDVAEMKQEAEQTLNRVAAQAQASGIPCDVIVMEGNPREQLTALARETHAGRIIAGTHGRRHLKKLLLGSVAHEILRSAEVPVCTIGPHAHEASSFGAPRKILHPVSLCAGFEQSARMAIEMAQFYRADITLLHVLPRTTHGQPDADRVVEWTTVGAATPGPGRSTALEPGDGAGGDRRRGRRGSECRGRAQRRPDRAGGQQRGRVLADSRR